MGEFRPVVEQQHLPRRWQRLGDAVEHGERLAIGLLYRNPDAPRYDQYTVRGLGMSREQKVAAIERELDRFAI